ncbi:thermonuclease family protein [Phytopseudomonas punonensis]|uniref:Endonuclease YncB, thermonuclease family n=1 Tax=Phytopseudomonas punonensis TaxID=1220495 RepID=A0A1M6Z9V2_9GAMM|nr:thermonuclease family protein [Pseudomonas punonensis]SHL27244.1 Endonuclease YncB, thermonuclease family [Pseudomonas punonensis]
MAVFASLKKASLVGAFFVSVFCLPAHALCPAPGKLPQAKVQRVVDGDTVRLVDGRSVRLIGLNAPELARKGQPAEPFAEAARKRLVELVAANDGRVGVKTGEQKQDRYGRTLAHLYDSRGNNLEAQLLAEGFGQLVAITPNVSLVTCHRAAERQARSARAGLWAQLRPLPARAVRSGGFVLLEGQVQRVERNRGGVWVELGNSVVLRIAPQVLDTFAASDLRDLQGKRVEARGWMIDRSRGGGLKVGQARWMLPLTHGAMLEVLR